MVIDKHKIIESDQYNRALEKYLSEGINYSANSISKSKQEDLEQLASDSFWQGCVFAINELEKIGEIGHSNHTKMKQNYTKLYELLKQARDEADSEQLTRISESIEILLELITHRQARR